MDYDQVYHVPEVNWWPSNNTVFMKSI